MRNHVTKVLLLSRSSTKGLQKKSSRGLPKTEERTPYLPANQILAWWMGNNGKQVKKLSHSTLTKVIQEHSPFLWLPRPCQGAYESLSGTPAITILTKLKDLLRFIQLNHIKEDSEVGRVKVMSLGATHSGREVTFSDYGSTHHFSDEDSGNKQHCYLPCVPETALNISAKISPKNYWKWPKNP